MCSVFTWVSCFHEFLILCFFGFSCFAFVMIYMVDLRFDGCLGWCIIGLVVCVLLVFVLGFVFLVIWCFGCFGLFFLGLLGCLFRVSVICDFVGMICVVAVCICAGLGCGGFGCVTLCVACCFVISRLQT